MVRVSVRVIVRFRVWVTVSDRGSVKVRVRVGLWLVLGLG